jgi:hypothetical protein
MVNEARWRIGTALGVNVEQSFGIALQHFELNEIPEAIGALLNVPSLLKRIEHCHSSISPLRRIYAAPRRGSATTIGGQA